MQNNYLKPEPRQQDEHRLVRCPYRQDMSRLFCGHTCGKGVAIDCPIYEKESGRLAYALLQK